MSESKYIVKRMGIFISGGVFLMMNTPSSLTGICLNALLVILLGIITYVFEFDFELLDTKKKIGHLCLALIMCLISGYSFYMRWVVSSKIQSIAHIIGLNNKTFLLGLSCISILISIPFVNIAIRWLFSEKREFQTERIISIISSKKFSIFCLFFSLVGMFLQIIFSFSFDVWTDEAFSLEMIKHNYGEMIMLTADDVHPPLYYLILKFFVEGICLLLPGMPVIYVSKIFSIIPFGFLLIISITKIRKEWGNYIAGMWSLAIMGMSSLISYGVEIRMYSWGLLFVTLSLLFMYDIVTKNRITDWILFMLSSLAAAYTHYFACIAVAVAYLFLFIWCVLVNRKDLKTWFLTSIFTVIGYLPWLFVFIKQAQIVSEDYWIPEIGWNTIIAYIFFMVDNNVVLLLCVFTISISVLIDLVNRSFFDYKRFYAVAAICIPIGTILVGVVASLLIRPVFMERYIVPGLASIWLGVLIASTLIRKKNANICLTIMIVLCSVINIVSFAVSEGSYLIQSKASREFFESTENAVFITNERHVLNIIEDFFEKVCYQWNLDIQESQVNHNNAESINSLDEIHHLLDNEKNVYFLESTNSTTIDNFVSDSNLSYSYMGDYRVQYKVKVYQITEISK